MEEKDMALLGFVASATDYLKNHLGEDYKSFEEIKDIDITKIKNELAKNLGSSLNNSGNSSKNLLNAGKDAFETFINDKPKLIDEFDEIFNVDFRKANREKDEKITNHLIDLLKGRTPEDDVIDDYAKIIASNCVEISTHKTEIKPAEEGMDEILQEIVSHENQEENNIEDEKLVETMKQYVDEVAKTVAIKEETEAKIFNSTAEVENNINDSEENIFEKVEQEASAEIVSNEVIEPEVNEEAIAENEENIFGKIEESTIENEDDIFEKVEPANEEVEEIAEIFNSTAEVENNINDSEENIFGKVEQEASAEIVSKEVIEPSVIEEPIAENEDDIFAKVEEDANVESIDEETIAVEEEKLVENIDTENDIKTIADLQENFVEEFNENNETLDDIFENAGSDNVEEPRSIELVNDEDYQKQEEQKTDDYIARLMNDLNSSDITDKIEENRKKEEEENRIYGEIKEVYPYLTDGFIRRVYDLRDSIEAEFKYGVKIIVLQRLKFIDVEGLRKFVEVIMQHDYLVNVDEDKMIVDVFKEFINEEGLVISEIFAIANQGRLLTGDYEGYRVLLNEQEGE